jgi:membrane protein YdbS with pleckstrin-like domain
LDRALAPHSDPGAPLAALVAIYHRMGLLHVLLLPASAKALRYFFFTAPNFFVITFALVVVWVYVVLAKRRLSALSATAPSPPEV